jgi:3-hydroxyisobutyrate dehydrogenase
MGAPMARNLVAAGHDVVVTSRTRKDVEGAAWTDSPRAVAEQADIVITMLPTPAIVEQVLLGPAGVLAGMRTGGTWVDMSTSTPEVAARVRALAEPRGIAVLDAPVAGMVKGAIAGTLRIYVGGDAGPYAQLYPVLRPMGAPEHVGPPGAGYVVKLMVNLLWFAQLVATAEVLAVGTTAGVALDTLRDALLASPASSNLLAADLLPLLTAGDYDETFAMALACKDLRLAVELARANGVAVELAELVEQLLQRARARYGDTAGELSPVRLYEDVTGKQLRLAPS